MAAYKRTDKKGWYISFYFQKTKIKIMNWRKINGINKPFETKTEAQLAETRYKAILENPTYNMSLYSLYDEYVLNTKSTLKRPSLKKYGTFKRNYLSLIKDVLIENLTPKDIVLWKNKIIKLDISSESKNNIKNIMLQVLKYGNQMYNIKGNLQLPLLENIKNNAPVLLDEKKKYIPPSDFEKLMNPLLEYMKYSNNLYYYTIFVILYNTGLRIGELAALTIKDIYPGYILVNKDYARVDGKDLIQTTKSKNSIRKVYLDNNTKEIINNYLVHYKPTNVLFKMNKEYITQQRVREKLKRLGVITKLDQEYELKLHNLRHSHASNLRKLGYDEVAISKRLGNTPNVALTTYMHEEENELQEMAKKLEKLKK